ncbi:Actinorhodin polyketide putative beta-ketoacyl synthase 2 [Actinomadura rubteroloni]|uniref:Actinorhodin polyketide putative beta-ketoacyl synthase 2 n=1 Tax=Actinomadura rubteroloni TaxID=1926885 RepID=A0A2P4UCQ5_9ACTN|nr:ketosynthase chain-length factor [Actinomadura rubteroloni]POM22830.1 Actinorhodin polyketide putative beta-ketoacyl synthase 2 [Actinomadura rubteroloni]
MNGQVAVTGLGLLTPIGRTAEAHWSSVLAGRHGFSELTRFDSAGYPARLAGQVTGFDAAAHLPGRLLAQTDVSTRFALVAAEAALADAGLDTLLAEGGVDDYDVGVITSNATGGFEFTHREFRKLWSEGPKSVSVYESFAWFYAVNTGQISIRHGLRGPGRVVVGEQAGGLDAIGTARSTVRDGTRFVVTGGVDSSFDPWGWVSHLSSGRISHADDPERAYLPFDSAANGYVPGEGGAILVLEDPASARERGIPVHGRITGYAATFDPPPGSDRPGKLGLAAELALADAGLDPADVDVVFADGAGLADLDRAEAAAIVALFGERGVPVTVPKTLTGRLYAGGGPVDVATALLALRDGVIPPTAHISSVPGHYGIDLVTGGSRPARLASALVLARGRHGFNAAVVVQR